MENNFGLVDLSEHELKECNGGFALLIIAFFFPSVKRLMDFKEGLSEGYTKATTS